MTRLLLISSSNVHGYGYLDHAETDIVRTFSGCSRVTFVPFAMQDAERYTAIVAARLDTMGFGVTQARDRADVESAEAIFVGGGNTFRLLKTLYERELVDAIRDRVRNGVPYIGSSAGTNIAAPTIMTTNDMPIVYPPTFDALGLVPYQINPHYLDPDPSSTHKGETREERIREFLEENDAMVVGLREGSMLSVENEVSTVIGLRPARIFQRGKEPLEIEVGARIP